MRGKVPEGHKPKGVTACLLRNTGGWGTDPWREQGFEAAGRFAGSFASAELSVRCQERHGSNGSERSAARQGGKTSKGEPHERSRHATRLSRLGEEETVRRARNPEGGTNRRVVSSGCCGFPLLICAEEEETP